MHTSPQRPATILRLLRAAARLLRTGTLIDMSLTLFGAPEGLYHAMHVGLTMIWFRVAQVLHGKARTNTCQPEASATESYL